MLLHLFLLCSLLLLRRFCVCLGTICFNNRIFFCCCLCCIGFYFVRLPLLFLVCFQRQLSRVFLHQILCRQRTLLYSFLSDYPVRLHMLLLLLLLLVVIVVFVFISSLASAQPVTLSPSTRIAFSIITFKSALD